MILVKPDRDQDLAMVAAQSARTKHFGISGASIALTLGLRDLLGHPERTRAFLLEVDGC